MEVLSCTRCGDVRDTTDNFCRRCGHQFTVNLPSVPEPALPVRTTPALPASVIGSVAVLAVGTGLEWLARRMAGSAARAAGRAIIKSEKPSSPTPKPPVVDNVTVDEVVYIRRVQLRR